MQTTQTKEEGYMAAGLLRGLWGFAGEFLGRPDPLFVRGEEAEVTIQCQHFLFRVERRVWEKWVDALPPEWVYYGTLFELTNEKDPLGGDARVREHQLEKIPQIDFKATP